MKKKINMTGKLSLKKELSKAELKQIAGGVGYTQTYCSGGGSGPFPVPGSTPIGCQPAYCAAAGHGTFLYCA